jgi:oligopeptide transport system substrate-binding protein
LVPPDLGGYQPPEVAARSLSDAERLSQAKALFSQAMTELGHDANQPPLTLHISTDRSDVSHRILQGIAAMLRKNLNVTVTLDEPEWRVWDAQFHRGDFDIVLYSWTADYDDPWTFLASWRTDAGMLNPGGYRNPSFDALLDQSRSLLAGPRLAILAEAERLLLADAPVIPLENDVMPYLVSPRVNGWHANAMEIHPARYISLKK